MTIVDEIARAIILQAGLQFRDDFLATALSGRVRIPPLHAAIGENMTETILLKACGREEDAGRLRQLDRERKSLAYVAGLDRP